MLWLRWVEKTVAVAFLSCIAIFEVIWLSDLVVLDFLNRNALCLRVLTCLSNLLGQVSLTVLIVRVSILSTHI